jgi:hypothetical protein
MIQSPLDSVLTQIFSGRAVLFAGQGLSDVDRRSLAATTGPSRTTPHRLSELLSDPATGQEIAALADKARSCETSPGTRRVCSVPWSMVVSSCVDSSLGQALQDVSGEARRIRHHFVDQPVPATLLKRPHLLDLIHLSRVSDPHEAFGRAPYGRKWRQVQQLYQPALLRTIPSLIGPAHLICIAGLGKGDPIDWRLIAGSLSEIDPERAVWFLSQEDGISAAELLAELPGAVVVQTSLADALRDAEELPEVRERLAHLRTAVLSRDDLVVSVRVRDTSRSIVFRASELQSFRRHLEVLPDMSAHETIEDIDERRRAFISFLGNPRISPNYEGFSNGFCFVREGYARALELVPRHSDLDRLNPGSK